MGGNHARHAAGTYQHYQERVRHERRVETAKMVALLIAIIVLAFLAGTMDYHDAQLMSTDVPGHVAEWQEGALDE